MFKLVLLLLFLALFFVPLSADASDWNTSQDVSGCGGDGGEGGD